MRRLRLGIDWIAHRGRSVKHLVIIYLPPYDLPYILTILEILELGS